ncbi:cytochrome c-type biogenesis protein [Aureimonas frigidaquae]|uniref:cytochrome c-type biogenesis protein n=1 Tax=Aureimonas frigidaquae TaxID=424757 RepID=UPI000780580F|nr:cytochrome c-type biogenesis protein [Aureimonas frigidaquae]
MRRLFIMLALFLGLCAPAMAVQPDEILADPAMEARARDISAGLRCLVCQNQSIDDSDAPLARDLRVLVRDRLEAGDSDGEVMSYIVARYGEFVLLRPPLRLGTLLLWGLPVLLLLSGGLYLWLSSRRATGSENGLSAEEERALEAIVRRRERG